LDEEKSKHAGLAYQNGFVIQHLPRFAGGWRWLKAQQSLTTPAVDWLYSYTGSGSCY